ncbi:hypothetical protein HSBAA_36340 [Vreelandella sulfidaeris]|uniref:LexA repressor DNA-binding domain-containing protein n=1 Tax=Vreelandella sulfidaeris TaxID=115553 RepID=A0A455UDC8_9GAMM|nr:hypothetical protein HSBAA_36340 [Halomonas sulfidaeris]
MFLIFIVKTMGEFGYPPTRAEIAKALGFRSPNAAEEHLRALERKGLFALSAIPLAASACPTKSPKKPWIVPPQPYPPM